MSRSTVVVCMLGFLLFSAGARVFALESDDPSDTRDWGRASAYQSLVDQLGTTPIAVLPIPVLLGVEVADLSPNFGDARGDGTRTHEGLDMMAKEGTPIVSPTDAVVTRTGNGVNSGLYVRTANPGGEQFVYMHLSEIASGVVAGTLVKRGEVIGYVGNTGNASGGAPHLHFEIRNNGAQDPYPRLTSVFTLSERMQGAAQALARTSVNEMAARYAVNFRATFSRALAEGIAIPPAIASALSMNVAPSSVSTTAQPATPASNADMVYGETNDAIRALQHALTVAPAGSSSQRLQNTGATGYFGPLTQAALKEYQIANGLAASGIVDAPTYAMLFIAAPVATPSTSTYTRDLEIGMSGEDVRMLQKFLNANGAIIASTGAGSPGNESNYFGALTRAALARYQVAHAITPAAGYFGPRTRAQMAQ